MTTTDDLLTLMTDELDSPDQERHLYASLTRTSLLFDVIGSLVGKGDERSLREICHSTLPLHELTERYADVVGAENSPPQAPFGGCDPVTGAVRAMAALGLILVCDDDAMSDHVNIVLEWMRHTNSVPSVGTLSGWLVPPGAYRDRLASVVDSVRDHEHGDALLAWLIELGQPVKRRASSSIEVLLDRGDSGVHATLRGRLLHTLPAAPIPDPRTMVMFSADERFRDGLATAWRNAGTSVEAAVLWSISDLDGSIDHIRDISLTSAFAVLFDELRRLGRRLRGPVTLRRVAARTAVVGGLDDDGRTVGVFGYANKMSAASNLDRVVVPAADLVVATSHSTHIQADLVGARTWQEAARASRKINRRVLLRTLGLATVVLLIGASVGGAIWYREAQRQHQRDTVRDVQRQAFDLSSEDQSLALLLAMAGDDLAAEVDEHPDILDAVLRGNSSLRRVLRSDEGTYDKIAMSQDGAFTLLSTTTGSAELVATRTGTTEWRRQGVGVESLAGGVHISAIAVSERGQRAAVATTDLHINLLERSGSSWKTTADITLPLPSRPGALNSERNRVTKLGFAPGGKALVAYGPEAGLFRFDPKNPLTTPQRCAAPASGNSLFAGDGSSLVTTEREVVRVDLTTCSQTRELTAPEGTTLHGAVDDDGTLAVATRGTQLLALRPNAPETLLSDRGPYRSASIIRPYDGAHVMATTDAGTYGWNVADAAQEFGHPGSGASAIAMGVLVRARGGTAEIHDGLHSPATVASAEFRGAEAVEWAGTRLILRTSKSVWIGPDTATTKADGFAKEENYRKLALPSGSTTREIATSPNGHWAAVLFRAGSSKRTQLQVWDVTTAKQAKIVLPDDQVPTHVAFADDAMYVGHYDGDLRRFRYTDGAWRYVDGTLLPTTVVALAARDNGSGVYAVVSEDSASKPSVIHVRGSDLVTVKEAPLEGGTALARIALLEDGQVVVGTGAGVITFLTPQLDIRGSYTDAKLRYVFDLTEIPGKRTVIISGRMTNTFLDTINRTPRAEFWGGGPPFNSADVSVNGLLVTYNAMASDLALWSLETEDLRKLACAAVGRDLTPEEWARFVSTDIPYHSICAG